MRAECRHRLGLTLAIIGFLGTITTCALPSWKVTAFIGSSNITAELIFEGLWMYWVVQSTGQIKCKVHSSVLTLPQDLRTARALVVISIIIGFFAVLFGVTGNKSVKLLQDEKQKSKVYIYLYSYSFWSCLHHCRHLGAYSSLLEH
uniref:Claudin n=1 Tax=Oreochromis niloticus TaxID=8128 RepID=A0A669EGW8_ORENI